MAYKEVGNELPEVWKPENEGDSIEGIFVRRKENVGKNKANVYLLEVDGKLKSVWGSTVLDNKMDWIHIGDSIRITYKGRDGEKDYHKYMVEKDSQEEKTD